ncbi:hypothetical protein [Rhodopirellula bahusiensis]|uniref:hypothetical protein n=1 Tax=Rhodopirellula bahusiensis TaxID=2014065 RepID=UPI00326479EC
MIKRGFGTFASNGTYVTELGLRVFCAGPVSAGGGEAASFLSVAKVAEMEVSMSIAVSEFAKQYFLKSISFVLDRADCWAKEGVSECHRGAGAETSQRRRI